MKAEPNYTARWANNDKHHREGIDAACAPVVAQRDELLARIESLEATLVETHKAALANGQQRDELLTRLAAWEADPSPPPERVQMVELMQERDKLLAEVERLKARLEAAEESLRLCADEGLRPW